MSSLPPGEPLHGLDSDFDRIARRYGRLIRSAIGRVAGPLTARLGDEIEQRVLTELFRQLAGERNIDRPASYLYRAAVRETIRVLRSEERLGAAEEQAAPRLLGHVEDPEKLLLRKELTRRVLDAIETLSEDRGRAVRAHLRGFRLKEIMHMYGWTQNRARNLLYRGMADLRGRLEELGIDADAL